MGRPRGSRNKPQITDLTCVMCGRSKKVLDFYRSYNPLHTAGYLPYCKDCLRGMCLDGAGQISLDNFKKMLQMIDRPYLYDIVKSSFEDKNDTIGTYMKNIAMSQYRNMGWRDSVFEATSVDADVSNGFVVTNELKDKWGVGYKPIEYEAFEKKYEMLKNNYPERTAMHTEALRKYVRYSVKEELATADNNVTEAKSWGQLAANQAQAAKINPSQLSAADLQDGLSTFGQLSRAVEQAVDIIPLLPKFKEKPQDKVDFTLFCYINYIRELKGLPRCKYKDIYKFYEERKNEYKEHLDFLKDDETEGDTNMNENNNSV